MRTMHLGWIAPALLAAFGFAGAAGAQDAQERPIDRQAGERQGEEHGSMEKNAQQGAGREQGQMGRQPDQAGGDQATLLILRNALDKPYFQGSQIQPRLEGNKVILDGYVPSKAHAVAATLACFQIEGVKNVDCHLNFPGEVRVGEARPSESAKAPGAGEVTQIEVVSQIVRAGTISPGESTLPAGASAGILDTFRISSLGGAYAPGGFERAIRGDLERRRQEEQGQGTPQAAPQGERGSQQERYESPKR